MTKISRGKEGGGRKKGRSKKCQKAIENLMGLWHDTKMNITKLSQQFNAVSVNISKINHLQKSYYRWRWHWLSWQTVRRYRYLTLRNKKAPRKRKAAAAHISSHHRHRGPAGSTRQGKVEAGVVIDHRYSYRLLSSDSPKGQDQQGGSVLGLGPDYPQSTQPHTLNEDHIDGPSLSNESSGSSSWDLSCNEEALRSLLKEAHAEYSQEALLRTGNSPHEPREGREHGQIHPPNRVSYSPTYPRRSGDYVPMSPNSHIIPSIPAPGHNPVPSTNDNNSNSLQRWDQEFFHPPLSELPQIKRCRHLRHGHSGGMPVVVLDRNQSDALGRLFFEMSPQHKKRRLESGIQEQDNSANDFSGSPETQGKEPMEGTSAGASVDAQKCHLFLLPKDDLVLEDEPTENANEILGSASQGKSQEGPRCRQRIVTTEEGDFIIQFGESDPENTVHSLAVGSDANEILGPAPQEKSQEGPKCRQCIVTTEEGDFIIQFGDSDPEDTVLSHAEGSDANQILGYDSQEESQKGPKCKKCIVTMEEVGFINQFGDSNPKDTVLKQTEASDALMGFYAASTDGSSAPEGSRATTDSETTDDSANWHRGSTPSAAEGSAATTDSETTDDSANWHRGSTSSAAEGSAATTDSETTDDSANWHRGSNPGAAEGSKSTAEP